MDLAHDNGGTPGSVPGESAGTPTLPGGGAAPAVTPPSSLSGESTGCGGRAARSSDCSGLAALGLLALGLVGRRRGAWLLLASLAQLGCGNKADASSSATAGDGSDCGGDFDTFAPGMSTQASPGDITVELTRAEPSPPVVRRDNVWWLKLTDPDGSALTGAQIVASPYMPKHQHGSAEVVVDEQGDGEYQLSPIELIMPGVWEIPLFITPAGGGVASETMFRFCIAER